MKFHHQSGIAIGPILFIVALLAILAAAISAGSGSFTGGTSNESAGVQAATIIQVGTQLQDAVTRVIQENSCSGTQISFSNPMTTSLNGGTDVYTNSNAPSNGSCNVFSPEGGAIQFPTVKGSTRETQDGGYFVFEGSQAFYGIGGSFGQPTLAAFLPVDSLATCQSIDKNLGAANAYLGQDHYADPTNTQSGHFTGSYYFSNTLIDDAGTAHNGLLMACIQSSFVPSGGASAAPTVAAYFFYVVLQVR